MANATSRDARAGWDIFRSSGGTATRAEVNARLFEAGYGQVSARMLAHYRHLIEAGSDRYISINRFDIARASEPYENAAAHSRYAYHSVDLGVQATFAKASRLYEASGRATEVGDVGALLAFGEVEFIEGLERLKPRPGDMVTVRYLEAGRSMAGRIVEVDLKSRPAIIEIDFSQLVSIASLTSGQEIATVAASYQLIPPLDEILTVDLVGRRLYLFFELIEGFRALVNTAGARQTEPIYAAPPLLDRLSVASPAEIMIFVAGTVHQLVPLAGASVALKAIGSVVDKRKVWHEGTKAKYDAEISRIEAELEQAELEQRRATSVFTHEVAERVLQAIPSSDFTQAEAEKMIKRDIIPTLESLAESGIRELNSHRDEHQEGPTGDV